MSETVTTDEKLAKLREIVKDVDICMLTTLDERGDLRSRPMSNNREVEFDGDLWFFTYGSSHKVDEVERAEYWDGSQSILTHAWSFVTSLFTGEQAELGENEKLELK